MRKTTKERILALIGDLPAKKLDSLIDSAEYLKEKEDIFTVEERAERRPHRARV